MITIGRDAFESRLNGLVQLVASIRFSIVKLKGDNLSEDMAAKLEPDLERAKSEYKCLDDTCWRNEECVANIGELIESVEKELREAELAHV